MFKVAFVCDDKKLADALRNLMGVAVGTPEIVPMVNAVKKNGKVEAASSGDTAELFSKYAKDNKLERFKAADMRAFCKSIGMSPNSYSYFSKQLQKARVIKRHGTSSNSYYTVMK